VGDAWDAAKEYLLRLQAEQAEFNRQQAEKYRSTPEGKAYHKAYYETHKEEIKARTKAFYAAHQAEQKVYAKIYYARKKQVQEDIKRDSSEASS
jgi:hypothetical protein